MYTIRQPKIYEATCSLVLEGHARVEREVVLADPALSRVVRVSAEAADVPAVRARVPALEMGEGSLA